MSCSKLQTLTKKLLLRNCSFVDHRLRVFRISFVSDVSLKIKNKKQMNVESRSDDLMRNVCVHKEISDFSSQTNLSAV